MIVIEITEPKSYVVEVSADVDIIEVTDEVIEVIETGEGVTFFNQLSDVEFTNLQDDDGVFYEASSGLWKNKPSGTGLSVVDDGTYITVSFDGTDLFRVEKSTNQFELRAGVSDDAF